MVDHFSLTSSPRGRSIGQVFCAVVFATFCAVGQTGCGGDSGPTPGSLAVTTTSLPEQTVNLPYSASVSGSGGAAPYTWSVSPALPGNLSLDPATGAITGTPTTAATTTHTFTLRDSSAPSQTVEQALNLTIEPPLAITTTSLPDASISSSYNEPVETVGGIGALTFSLVLPGTGTLPSTFSLNPTTGLISGTPIAPAGTFPFTVRVQDTSGQQDTKDLSVRVTPTSPPQITTTSLPEGRTGQPYSARVQATGGIGALGWAVSAGTLPSGLALNQSTGVISGTPILPVGTSSFTVRIQDAAAQSATKALSITINPFNVPNITTTTLHGGTVGQAYNQTLRATGGLGALTWSVTGGSLPAGLTLTSAGTISGTPAAAETSNFTVTVTDTFGQSDTQDLSIAVSAANEGPGKGKDEGPTTGQDQGPGKGKDEEQGKGKK
jgi:large repetitive protein